MLYRELDNWYQTNLGGLLLAQEKQSVDDILSDIVGSDLLIPSTIFHESWTEKSMIKRQVMVSETRNENVLSPTVFGDFMNLPFFDDMFDLVLLPHFLEFQENPTTALIEFSRVVRPDGYIMILGFNPVSLWGFYHFFRYRQHFPKTNQWISAQKVSRILKKCNFEIQTQRSLFYKPPIQSKGFIQRLQFLEYLNQYPWFGWGATYILLAKKKLLNIVTMKPQWKTDGLVIDDKLVGPTTRSIMKNSIYHEQHS